MRSTTVILPGFKSFSTAMSQSLKAAFTVRMSTREARTKRKIARNIEEMGRCPVVERFLNKYGKDNTKRIYALELALYLRWLKHTGIELTPDQLITDNLRCVYESSATDVTTKRKHTDWLEGYVNTYLVEKGHAQ